MTKQIKTVGELKQAYKLSQAIVHLNVLDQRPPSGDDKTELQIGKNDPKNGQPDYWWCAYGSVYLSGYYSLTQMLIDFSEEISGRKII